MLHLKTIAFYSGSCFLPSFFKTIRPFFTNIVPYQEHHYTSDRVMVPVVAIWRTGKLSFKPIN